MIYFFPQGSSKPNLSYSNLPSIQLSVDSDCKESTCNAGDLSSIPELGRSPGEGNLRDEGSIPGPGRSPRGGHSNPLQYFCLENPMDRGVWWATVHRVTKSWTWLKRLSTMLTYNSAGVSLFLIYLPSVTTYSVYDTVQNNKEATRNQIAVTRYRELKSQSESHLVVSDSLQPHGL